jgi:hypothetical protein
MQTGSQGNKLEQQGAQQHVSTYVRIVLTRLNLCGSFGPHIGCNCKLESSLFYSEVEDRNEVAIVSAVCGPAAARRLTQRRR